MSKIRVLGLDNSSVGQFDGILPSLGWSLNGHPSVSGGGSTTVKVPDEVAVQPWLNFGRMVLVQPADLEPYLGMIDTPWSAASPVTMSVYDPEYLFNLRIAEAAPIKFTGNVGTILNSIINVANAQQDRYLRMGNVGDIDKTYREETLDNRPLWEQLKALLQRSSTEMKFRAEQGNDRRWYLYVDIASSLGVDTDFLLSDGDQANMKIRSATVRGEIINRVIGISSQSTAASRLQTTPMENAESVAMYGMRSRFVQFRDVVDRSTLEKNTLNALHSGDKPYLELAVEVENIDHCFLNMRLGNRVMAHAAKIMLPGGVRGWRGKTRITKMAYVENSKTLYLSLTGDL